MERSRQFRTNFGRVYGGVPDSRTGLILGEFDDENPRTGLDYTAGLALFGVRVGLLICYVPIVTFGSNRMRRSLFESGALHR